MTKDNLKKIVGIFRNKVLKLEIGQPLPPLFFTKLNKITYYSEDVIVRTAEEKSEITVNGIYKNGITDVLEKIAYAFTVIENNLANVMNKMESNRIQNEESLKNNAELWKSIKANEIIQKDMLRRIAQQPKKPTLEELFEGL